MSYNPYNNQGGYGQRNPYDQRDPPNPYAQQRPYGQQNYDNYGNSGNNTPPSYGDVEMQPLANQGYPPGRTTNGAGAGAGASGRDPNAILNDCRAIDESLDQLEYALQDLAQTQRAFISNASGSTATIDSQAAEIMSQYRSLTDRVRKVKSSPVSGDPRNAPQVGKVDRRLKKAIQEYQKQDSDFRKQVTEQQMRQYRIVRPEATEDEVRDAVGEGSGQIFQQALMQSDRRGAAQSALRSVQARHDAIQKIERDIVELSQLFQDLDQLVMEQEPLVQNIEQKAEETKDNIDNGTQQLDGAISSARARNRKKWWCLLIVVLIIIIIAVVVGVVVAINNNKPKRKRSLLEDSFLLQLAPIVQAENLIV